MTANGKVPDQALTEREQEILSLVANGLTNQQIADRIYLTLDTVKWYNRQINQKLGVHTRGQAVASARELGLLGNPSAAVKHNLPSQNLAFVGREQELSEIRARLAEPACRLLTLLGPGGIGKTRLAIEAARRQIEHFPDGVYLVSFAPVESPAFVIQALADGLGLTLTNQQDSLEQIITALREKTVLLLVDNFEHLLDGVHLLGEVLTRTKSAKLLVTSRERLHLKQEWLFDVQGLHYPPAGGEGAHLTGYDAAELFMCTAKRVRSDFAPEGDDVAHIGRICRLVGGMPLGIELAASWVRVLSCEVIAREIAHNLDILTTSWRDVPERHRSIRAVLNHSWKLMTSEEQDVFCKLAVFRGPFGRQAAAEVADASLGTLLSLVDKSLLQHIDQERFGIHELLKQYGGDRLQTDPDAWAAAQLSHCRYHAACLAECMSAPDARLYLGAVENVFDDIQMAWRCAVEQRQLAQIQRLAEGLLVYYRLHSWYRAGAGALAVYQQALTCFDPGTRDRDHRETLACLYESIGDLQELATAHPEAVVAYEAALNYTAEDDYTRRGRLHGKAADVWVLTNRHEQGHDVYTLAEAVLEQASQRDTAWWREWLRIETQRMELYYWQNRPDDMDELANRIHPLVEEHGSLTQRVRYLYLLGMMALRRSRYFYSEDAITYTGQALALSLDSGNLGDIAARHFYHGFAHLWSDHLDEAERHLQIAREMTEQNGDLTLLTRALAYLTVVDRKRGDIQGVRESSADTLRVAGEAKMPQYTGMARAHLSWLAWRAGKLDETKRLAQAAIQDWGGLGQAQSMVPLRWFAYFPLMGVALQEKDYEAATQWAEQMITPPQQRLPEDLTKLLERAVAVGKNGSEDAVHDLLHQAFQRAHELHYV